LQVGAIEPGLLANPGQQGGDIELLIALIMQQCAQDAEDDLRAILAELQAGLAAKKALRDLIRRVKNLIRGLAAGSPPKPGKSMLGNVLWSWLFSIFPHGCCMIIAPTRRRVSHTLTVMCMPVSSGTDIHSRNSSGSIIFGQEWMPRLLAWAAAIISTFPPSDRIGVCKKEVTTSVEDSPRRASSARYTFRRAAETNTRAACAPQQLQFAGAVFCACNRWTCLSRLPIKRRIIPESSPFRR
jgi:hypothetical protein